MMGSEGDWNQQGLVLSRVKQIVVQCMQSSNQWSDIDENDNEHVGACNDVAESV